MNAECVSGNLMSLISDHLPNFVLFPFKKNKKTNNNRPKIRDFKNFKIDKFRDNLNSIQFLKKIKTMNDSDQMYSFFHNGMDLLFEMHCPLKTMSKKELKSKRENNLVTKSNSHKEK